MSLTEAGWKKSLLLTLKVTEMRLRILSRYKGWFAFDFIMPVVFAALPILMGVSVAGGMTQAGDYFEERAGTSDFVLFILIGSIVMTTVETSMGLVGSWLRWERQTGTLESIYMAPAPRLNILMGVSLYSGLRGMATFILTYIAGSLLFGVNPFTGNMALALLFFMAGLLPLSGLSFFYGALILKIREAGELMNMLAWGMSFLMGAYYPITVFPAFLRYIALLFPPTWIANDVRASLIGVSYFMGAWYWDLGVLLAYSIIMPLAGILAFTWVERRIMRNEGVGKF